ncbi:MAG: hypothetical protein QNJ16_20055 [Rhodobacter sp.]|nr:hypothetical protein [Rhodobacter sp.]
MSRNRFTRILTTEDVNRCIDMLNTVSEKKFPHVTKRTTLFRMHAPDGDEVFSGARLQSDRFACMLHREVFAE